MHLENEQRARRHARRVLSGTQRTGPSDTCKQRIGTSDNHSASRCGAKDGPAFRRRICFAGPPRIPAAHAKSIWSPIFPEASGLRATLVEVSFVLADPGRRLQGRIFGVSHRGNLFPGGSRGWPFRPTIASPGVPAGAYNGSVTASPSTEPAGG